VRKFCGDTLRSSGASNAAGRDRITGSDDRRLLNKFNSAIPEEKEETAKAIGQSVGVSLLITQAQRSQLRELGFHEEQIRSMKPIEAHQILGIAS
jgi:hypothetical protein